MDTHGHVQNEPDTPDNKSDITDNKSYNSPDTIGHYSKPDNNRTTTGHYRTSPDKPDNRTPRAQACVCS